MVIALFMEHFLELEPCPLCITQRLIVVVIGVVAFIAWLQNPGAIGLRFYGGLTSLLSAVGIGVAGRHVWLQNLPEDKAPACGPDLAYMFDSLPIFDLLSLLFKGDGNCAEVAWTFLGLSIPAWTLIAFIGLLGVSIWQILRKNN